MINTIVAVSAVATIVFGLLGILYGALRLYGTIVTENLERCADVADFFERKGYRDRYATILNFSLRKLSKYFHKPLSGHALDRCIVIAGSYTYLSFLSPGQPDIAATYSARTLLSTPRNHSAFG